MAPTSFNLLSTKKRNKLLSKQLEDLVYVRGNLKLALSSVSKDSSSPIGPQFEPTPSAEEDDLGVGMDSDNSNKPIVDDDRYSLIDESDHKYSAIPLFLCFLCWLHLLSKPYSC